jgi:taurine transport system substrate-binding protein
MLKPMHFVRQVFALIIMSVTGIVTVFAAEPVTIGHQLMLNPWKQAIASGAFEEATGREISWKKFSSGSKLISAMASGAVDIGVAGSSPIAAGVSRDIPVKLFWILEDIAAAEALVVRNGSNINAPHDLKGKRVGVPFVSTTHFHLLFALEQFGINPDELSIRNMQPNQIAAAWERGDIDAAFVWDPALARIKESGKVLITSGQLSAWGKATFDGMLVADEFAANNADFMAKFVGVIAAADAAYRDDPKAWNANPANAEAVAQVSGADAGQVAGTLALYKFPTLAEQVSSAWLGGGSEGGAARALLFTSEFLHKEGKIDTLQPDYSAFVTAEFAEAAR